jgi:hypothetical protein
MQTVPLNRKEQMAKFRKKPVVIEAVQWGGYLSNEDEVRSLCGDSLADPYDTKPLLVIRTLEGDMTAHQGDWIIKGVKGECYPCKPDIFEATYELVEGE